MFTPQQIDQISFNRVAFGGYDMQAVDEFLEPLTEDYVTLYKENALLKSKMKVLVNKLEEYRQNEASMKDAIVNAQKTCDLMVKEAEAKCTQMLIEANAAAAENAKNADALIAAENARVEEARAIAAAKITELQEQIRICIQALERIKEANRPAPNAAGAYTGEASHASTNADAVADEISANLENLVGTTDDAAPKAEPRHPANDTTTSKFTNLQFGKNYDPTSK
jgi:cell division initiation protein